VKRKSLVLLCALGAIVATGSAQTVNKIYQHNGAYQDPNDPNLPNLYYYYVAQGAQTIVISHGIDGQTFVFEAALENNGVYEDPGDIRSIIAVEDAGTVALTIVGQPGHDFGAREVGTIQLAVSGVTGTVEALTISSTLNGQGPSQAHAAGVLNIGNDVLDNIDIAQGIGSLTIGGALSADVSCATLGDVKITKLDGAVSSNRMGNVTIGDAQHLSHTGSLLIADDEFEYDNDIIVNGSLVGYGAGISIHGSVGEAGSIDVTDSLERVYVRGAFLGAASITGDLYEFHHGDPSFWGNMVEFGGDLICDGNVHVISTGLMTGGKISVAGSTAYLYIWGGMLSGARAEVGGPVLQLVVDGSELAEHIGLRGTVSCAAVEVTAVVGPISGTLHVYGRLENARVESMPGGRLEADTMSWLGVHAGHQGIGMGGDIVVRSIDWIQMFGKLSGSVTADTIGTLDAYEPLTGSVAVTGTLSEADFSAGILTTGYIDAGDIGQLSTSACAGTVQAGSIEFLEVTGAFDGTLTVTGALATGRLGRIDDTGVVDAGYIDDMTVSQWVRGRIDAGSMGGLTVTGGTTGTVQVTGTLGHAHLGGLEDGAGIKADTLTFLWAQGITAGDVTVTGTIGTAQFGYILPNSHIEAGGIDNLTAYEIMGQISAGNIYNASVSGGMSGTLSATNDLTDCGLSGVAPGGTVTAAHIGHLTVSGAVAGTVTATDTLTSSTFGSIDPNGLVETANISDVTVGGTVAGRLAASGTLDGSVQVGGLPATGHIQAGTVNGDLGVIGDAYGTILVDNDLPGNIWIVATVPSGSDGSLFGTIRCTGFLEGLISVNGTLQDDPNDPLSGGHIIIGRAMLAGATITVAGDMDPNTEFVAVRYLGWGNGETGYAIDPNATVTIGTHDPCHGDCPDINVRAIDPCLGDGDNNGYVEFDDLDLFIAILTDPGAPEAFALAYPGLGGTAEDGFLSGGLRYHYDVNCDGLVDFDDINPFIEKLSSGECSSVCGGGQELMAATELAAGLRAHVPQVRHGALRAFAAQVIAHHHNRNQPQQRAYWQQVLAGLQ
jgi:hypothetical protein